MNDYPVKEIPVKDERNIARTTVTGIRFRNTGGTGPNAVKKTFFSVKTRKCSVKSPG